MSLFSLFFSFFFSSFLLSRALLPSQPRPLILKTNISSPDDEGRGVLCDLGVAITVDDGDGDGDGEDGMEGEKEEEDRMEEDGNGDNGDASAPPPPASSSAPSPNRKRSRASDPHPTQPSGGHSRRHMVGTLEYMPPEILKGHSRATSAADVYAWAVTANALATRTLPPFVDCDKPTPACHTVLEFGYGRQELVAAVAGAGLRPRLASRSLPVSSSSISSASPPPHDSSSVLVPPPPPFLSLIETCWHADPRERPSASEVARECLGIEEEVRSQERRLLREKFDEEAAFTAANGGIARAAATAKLGTDDSGSAAAALLGAVGLDSSDDDGDDESDGGGRPWPPPGWDLPADEEDPSPSSPSYAPSVAAAAFEAIGRREAMEDASLSCSPLYNCPSNGSNSNSRTRRPKPAHLFAVFDGHRGAGAARYARRSLRRHLRSVWESSRSPEEALSRAFVRLDARWRRREAAALALAGEPSANGGGEGGENGGGLGGREGLQRRQRRHCGAAATAALFWGDSLTVANVGDCRAILAISRGDEGGEAEEAEESGGGGDDGAPGARRRRRPSWCPLRLTVDHSADDPTERARVETEGGTLIPPPPGSEKSGGGKGWRLGPVGLAVTRALGDADVLGCSAIPFVSSRKLTASCVALILMTDGVTEAMEARKGDVTSFELEAKRKRRNEKEEVGKNSENGDDEQLLSASELVDEEIAALIADTVKEAGMAARRLVVEAVEHRQGRDNAAALVAYLRPVETLERVF